MHARIALLASLLAACGTNGSDAHAGESAYVPTDRAYRLWYATPPWQIVDVSVSDAPVLDISYPTGPEADSGVPNSLTVLRVNVANDTPDDLVAARLAQAASANAMLIYAARSVAVSGGTGTEAAFGDGFLVHRFVAAMLSDGRAVSLEFASVDSIQNDPDITGMIGRFEPRPPPVNP